MNKQTINHKSITRRSFVGTSAMALGAISAIAQAQDESAQSQEEQALERQQPQPESNRPPIVIFSKHLQWLNYEDLAKTVKDMGFDGVDLTVRPGGHVLPENVRTDLPKAVEAIRNVGLDVPIITTRIDNPEDEIAQHILQTASKLGIKFYRIGSYRYNMDEEIMPQLKEVNNRLKTLAAMNETYDMVSAYHNHSGFGYMGGAIWDIHQMMLRLPVEWMGCNYDIGHAVNEGSNGSWAIDFELIAPRIKSSAVKDFGWFQEDDGSWDNRCTPMGEGFVPWDRVLTKMKEINFTGPFSMHFEYDIGGESEEEERQNHIDAFTRDLEVFRGYVDKVWG